MTIALATIKRAMANYRGDDFHRAKQSFRGLTPEEMQSEHGHSGQTKQQILDCYEQREREWLEADALLRATFPDYLDEWVAPK